MTDYTQLSREALLEELYALQRRLQAGRREREKELTGEGLHSLQVELEMQNRELRNAQQQLEEVRDRYADLYDFAPIGYLTLDGEGCIGDINLTGAGMLGQPRAKLIGKPFANWLSDHDIQRFQRYLKELSRAGGFSVSGLRLVQKPHPLRYVLLEGGVIGSATGADSSYRVAMVDITTTRKAEEALRRSVTHYRSLFNDSPLPLAEFNLSDVHTYLSGLPADRIATLGEAPRRDRPVVHKCIRSMHLVDANQAALDLFGASDAETLREGLAALLTTSSWRVLSGVFGLLMRGMTTFAHQLTLRRCDGRVINAIVHVNVVADYLPSLSRIMLAVVDITARHRAEQELRESEQRFRALVEQSPLSTLLFTPEGTVKEANPACLNRWGLTMENLQGYNILKDEQLIERGVMPVIERGFNDEAVTTVEYKYDASRFPGSKGESHWLRLHIHPIRIRDRITEVVVRDEDVTKERQAREEARQRREELAHIARLSVMGEMATSLAHEVNQPLAAISNYAQACRDLLATPDQDNQLIEKTLRDIANQATRASEVIRRIRDFVRPEPANREPTAINLLITEAILLLEGKIDRCGVLVHHYLGGDLPAVTVDPILIEQVVLNIVNNALDAMRDSPPEKRHLTIRTRLEPVQGLQLEFEDTGPGISQKVIAQIFNPFYTTKTRGMGMGLAISRTIVEAHGGTISMESEPGRGSRCIVTLPIGGDGDSQG